MNARRILLSAVVGASMLVQAQVSEAVAPEGEAKGNSELARQSRIGLSIAPVPLDLKGRNRALVGLGSYLVNGPMDCVGCHHAERYLPGGDPFLGEPEMINTDTYLGGGVPFGPFVSRNLTPDRNGRPAGLSLAEFTDVLRNGTDYLGLLPDPGTLQVMPWPEYRHSTPLTVRALYEYLSAIPCLEGGPGVPVNRCEP